MKTSSILVHIYQKAHNQPTLIVCFLLFTKSKWTKKKRRLCSKHGWMLQMRCRMRINSNHSSIWYLNINLNELFRTKQRIQLWKHFLNKSNDQSTNEIQEIKKFQTQWNEIKMPSRTLKTYQNRWKQMKTVDNR